MADNDKPAPKKRAAKATRRGRRLSSTEKAEAIGLWRAGSVTLDELAARFDRDRTTFVRLFNAEGVVKGEAKVEHEQKVAEAVESAALGDAGLVAERIRDTKEEHYKMASGMAKLTWTLIAECRREKRSVATIVNDLKSLKYAAEVIKTMREERFAVLGLNDKDRDDDTPMPDLVLRELTADEIKKMTNARIEEDDLGIPDGGFVDIGTDDDGSLV